MSKSATTVASQSPEVVTIPPATFLVVEGQGSPRTLRFKRAVRAIYSVAYTLKMQLKVEGQDFRVPPLEALWWADGSHGLQGVPTRAWRWKLLLRMPDSIDAHLVKLVKDSLVGRRHLDEAADVRLERLEEGPCVQALHVGPYSAETETIGLMQAYMVDAKLLPTGPHHEIYLSDPNRTRPERLKTILRQPVS